MASVKNIKFLLKIGQDMNILPGTGETGAQYVERVILSAGAKWMMTAVHNREGKVSIDTIKKTAYEKISNYLEIVDYSTPIDVQAVVNYLYDSLLANGMFYHEPNNVRPVRNREIGVGNISLIRGLLPEENVSFSGMAPYILGGGDANLAEEFLLWQKNREETIRSAWLHSSPQDIHVTINEYLRVDHQMYQKYYDTRRQDHSGFTIGRNRKSDKFGFDYYLIRGNEIRRLTDDYIRASIHTYVALAIVNDHRKQMAFAKVGKDLVELEVGYMLPGPDARFLRFVSWPESLRSISTPGFNVNLHPWMWPVVRERLNFLGFAVEEQHE